MSDDIQRPERYRDVGPSDQPSDRERPPITERQREARRANRAKSRGPSTAAGKAQSRRNSLRHGLYAAVLYIEGGTLGEDPREVRAYIMGIVKSLQPPDHALAVAAAYDVGRAQWGVVRVDRWEAYALSFRQPHEGIDHANHLEYLAECDRFAGALVGLLDDDRLTSAQLLEVLGAVGSLPGPHGEEWTGVAETATPGQIRCVINDIIAQAGSSRADSIARLMARATERQHDAAVQRTLDRPYVVRREMTLDTFKYLEDLRSRASREVDRALHRYYEILGRIEGPHRDE